MKKLQYSALAAVLWGGWLLNPAYDTFSSGAAFSVMARIAPEETWGTVVGIIGLLGLWAVRTGWLRLEIYAAVGLFFVWIVLVLVYAVAAFQTTGVPIYSVLVLITADAYIAARIQWLKENRK